MFRILLFVACLVWASLLLISWGGTIDPISPAQAIAASPAKS